MQLYSRDIWYKCTSMHYGLQKKLRPLRPKFYLTKQQSNHRCRNLLLQSVSHFFFLNYSQDSDPDFLSFSKDNYVWIVSNVMNLFLKVFLLIKWMKLKELNDYAVFDELLVYGPKFVFFFTFTIWINVVDSWFLDSLTLTLHISKTYLSNAFQVYRIQIFSITVRNFSNFYRSMEIKVTLIPTFVRNQNPRRKMRQSMRMTNLMPNMCQDHPKDEVLPSMKP